MVKNYALPLCFGCLLAIYLLDATLGLFNFVPSVENRRPAAYPQIKWDFLDPYPRDYEAYYNDNFRWRGRFQAFNARLQTITNGRSPLPDLVVLGEEDWFYKGGLQLDIYRGKRRFSPTELTEVVSELQTRRDSVTANGGRYLLAVAPLKHHVYPQFLPDYVKPLNPEYATRQLYRALAETEVEFINLHAALATYADTAAVTDLYYKTDHHWTVRAGLIASDAIAARLGLEAAPLESNAPARMRPIGTAGSPPPSKSPYYLTGKKGRGMTLAELAGRVKKEQETFYTLHKRGDWATREVPRTDVVVPEKFPYPKEYVRQREQKDSVRRNALPTLFVNRESFGQNILLPLSEHFGKSYWLFDEWDHKLNLDDYRREGGDVYLQLIWEGFIFNLLDEPVEDGKW